MRVGAMKRVSEWTGIVHLWLCAQQANITRIGYLMGNHEAYPHGLEAFRQGLRDLGYIEGSNVLIEHRDGEGKFKRLPLVALKAEAIVAPGTPHALASTHATRTPPVVFVGPGDPVTDGLSGQPGHCPLAAR